MRRRRLKLAKESRMRLNKFLSDAGVGSRRAAEGEIRAGKVTVNGVVVTNPAHQVEPGRDRVVFQGNELFVQTLPTYIVLNKPPGYITSARDERGRDTVFRLVQTPVRVFPVGRLDRDSEGLLLFTNDGELANRLIHPRYKVAKKYLVHLNRPVGQEVQNRFRSGVLIDRRFAAHADVELVRGRNSRECVVTLTEGKNRQIRKMFAAVGYRVVGLQRFQLGPLQLGKLKPGTWRYLTKTEIEAVKKSVGLHNGNHE